MADLLSAIQAMPAEQRAGALTILDMVSRPLTAREIEGLLRVGGVPRSRAVKLASELKRFHVIALAGPEQ